MKLSDLAVQTPAVGEPITGAFYLKTCQRTLCAARAQDLASRLLLDDARVFSQIFYGAEAYSFLLRVASGLESPVVGETDVFGQFKEAWKVSIALDPELDFWIRKVFEDTKEIRAQHLQHLGGVSYGSIVRRFMKQRSFSGEPCLLIGAGQLARSVVEFLTEQELLVWNRGEERARELVREIGPHARLARLEDFKSARQAIICVPFDSQEDTERVRHWKAGTLPGSFRPLLHMGGVRAQAGEWANVENAYFLDDVFALQKSQGEVRSVKVAQAIAACDERAKLRALGTSISIPHGWEDLAAFG